MNWLFAPQIASLLAETVQRIETGSPILKIAKWLRRQVSPEQSAQMIELSQLRIKARRKFSLADQLFFSRKGFEQSTSENISRYKANLFAAFDSIVDGCAGIGGDAMQLGVHGQLQAIERDEVHAQFLQANLETAQCHAAQVACADFLAIPLPMEAAVHIDPDRRDNRRTIVPSMFQPSLHEIIAKVGDRPTAIKIAPASRIPQELRPKVHLEWIGENRECKQQVVWLNHAVRPAGGRTTTVVSRNGEIDQLAVNQSETISPGVVGEIDQWVIEPHACVIAAGLTDSLAGAISAQRLAADVDYLTAAEPATNSLAASFRVHQIVPIRIDAIRQVLQELNIGVVEWKKRGVGAQFWDNVQRMKLAGDQNGVVILTKHRTSPIAIIATRELNRQLDRLPADDECKSSNIVDSALASGTDG